MKIALNNIKPSPHPIRTSWDEDKLNELAQSIREQGLIVPVKVRPVNGSYELVYGHRRTEAARRAGLAELECVVEGLDDTDTLIQALIENVQREDLSAVEKAKGLHRLIEQTGWSRNEVARRGIMDLSFVSRLLSLLEEPAPILAKLSPIVQGNDFHITEKHIRQPREVGLSPNERISVIDKAEREELTSTETRQVAESYSAAEDDAEREAILSTDYHDPAFQQLVRAKATVKRRQQRKEQKERQDNPREVKEYIEAVQTFSAAVQLAIKVADFGKFSPEAGQFLKGWHNSVRNGLDRLEQVWEEKNA